MTDDQFGTLVNLIKSVKTDLREEMYALHERSDEKIDALRDELRAEMHEGFLQVYIEIRGVKNEIKSQNADIEELQEQVKEQSGYTKEIDHVLVRVGALEQYTGMCPVAA